MNFPKLTFCHLICFALQEPLYAENEQKTWPKEQELRQIVLQVVEDVIVGGGSEMKALPTKFAGGKFLVKTPVCLCELEGFPF